MEFIAEHLDHVHRLCQRHSVDKLYLFGSAVNNSLTENSDIDMVVKFKEIDLRYYAENYFDLKNQLQSLFHRNVDLLEEQAIRNPFVKSSIDKTKKLIYG